MSLSIPFQCVLSYKSDHTYILYCQKDKLVSFFFEFEFNIPASVSKKILVHIYRDPLCSFFSCFLFLYFNHLTKQKRNSFVKISDVAECFQNGWYATHFAIQHFIANLYTCIHAVLLYKYTTPVTQR